MRAPEEFNDAERDLDGFVAASKTSHLAPACKLLFIAGTDLEWARGTPGLYLVDESIEDEYSDEYQEARGLTASRAELNARGMARRIMAPLVAALSKAGAGADEVARQTAFAMEVIKLWNAHNVEEHLMPLAIGELGFFTDLLADSLLRACCRIRERVLNATGLHEGDYQELVHCLRRIDALIGPVVRVAYPAEGMHPEISFAGHGLAATLVDETAHEINIFRLAERLEVHKSASQDAALPLFIANYINKHSLRLEPLAFACARYGNRNTPDFDVVIPTAEIGVEVKLYSSPATQTDDKLDPKVAELRKQLGPYSALAKAKKVYYVTNLPKEQARGVAQRARAGSNLAADTELITVAGLDELMLLLNTMTVELDQAIEVVATTSEPAAKDSTSASTPNGTAPRPAGDTPPAAV